MGESNDLLAQILGRGPSQSTFFLVLTRMKQEGRSSQVIQECIKALCIYPDDLRLRRLLAESYFEVGFIGQAEAELDRVTSDIGNLISAYKLQAQIYIQQQRLKEASEALKRYLAHNPDDQEALDLLDRIKPVEQEPGPEVPMAQEDVAQTAQELEELAELATPTFAEICYNQGQIHEAISTYEEVVSNNPDDIASMRRLVELKTLIAGQRGAQVTDKDNLRASKEKTIAILEGWLARIQESSRV